MDFGQNVAAVLVLVDWLTVCGCTNRSYTPIKAVMCIPEIGTTEAVLVILYDAVAPFPSLSQLVSETTMYLFSNKVLGYWTWDFQSETSGK